MPIGTDEPLPDLMPASHLDALRTAVAMLVDEWAQDLAALEQEVPFEQVSMVSYLPRRYLPRYDLMLAKKFFICMNVVAWKLWAPGKHKLACVAEELALAALVSCAEGVTEGACDFTMFMDMAFEDGDYEVLFDGASDGVEDTDVGEAIGMANLKFDEWFLPFNDTPAYRVHPYVEQDA